MIYLTDTGKIWSLFIFSSELIAGILAFAIAILVLVQISTDSKSRAFAGLALNIGLYEILCCASDIVGRLDPPHLIPIFNMIAVVLGMLPTVTFIFLMEYLNLWTRPRKLLLYLQILYIGITICLALDNAIFTYARYLPDGTFEDDYQLPAMFLLGAGELSFFYTFGVLMVAYVRQYVPVNRQFFIGLVLAHLGGFSYLTVALPKYSISSDFLMLSVLVLVKPVLGRRFDPLSELNDRLEHRAALLRKVTQIGQRIVSSLDLDSLLAMTVQDIQVTLGYARVSLYLRNGKQLVVNACSGLDAEAILAHKKSYSVDEDSPIGGAVQTGNVAFEDYRRSGPGSQAIRSGVNLPLVDSVSQVIGVLVICSSDAFSEDELEVFHLLAQHISTAIHNASLFKQTQAARRIADEASEAKTHFLSVMSHELRNALNIVVFYSQSLDELEPGTVLDDSQRTEIGQIKDASFGMKQLVDNILDFVKIEAGEVELERKPLDFIPILDRVKRLSATLLQPSVSLIDDYSNQIFPLIYADEIKLSEIFMNLMTNACKLCKYGSITVSAQIQGDMILFSVSDTGPGVPDELRATLFNRFKQARNVSREHGGSGLGLSICKLLVNLQGGQIWFEPGATTGATFCFTLPIASSEQIALHESTQKSPRTPTASNYFEAMISPLPLQALLLASATTDAQSVTTLLDEQGYQAFQVTEGLSRAIEFALAIEPDFIVIIHDESQARIGWTASLRDRIPVDCVVLDCPSYQKLDGLAGVLSLMKVT